MKTLIVYDSVFGNTEKIAQAIGNALSFRTSVEMLRVGDAKLEHLTDLDVLVVGSLPGYLNLQKRSQTF